MIAGCMTFIFLIFLLEIVSIEWDIFSSLISVETTHDVYSFATKANYIPKMLSYKLKYNVKQPYTIFQCRFIMS